MYFCPPRPHLPACPSTFLSAILTVYLPTCPSVSLSAYLSAFQPVCLSASVTIFPPAYHAACPHVCLLPCFLHVCLYASNMTYDCWHTNQRGPTNRIFFPLGKAKAGTYPVQGGPFFLKTLHLQIMVGGYGMGSVCVICNSDTFEKLRPSGFSKFPKFKSGH